MFSAPSQTTQRPAPFNPFATTSAPVKTNPFASNSGTDNPFGGKTRQASPFDVSGDANAKPALGNPFASPAPVVSNGATQPVSVFGQPSVPQKNPFAGSGSGPANPFAQAATPNAGFPSTAAAAGFAASSTETAPSSRASNADLNAQQPKHSNDPHAKKVYQQLRKDNISPPSWPSQPGNPSHKGEMAKFREKYEAYRAKVRASLTKAGLIDDPEQRKNLSEAIDFKGICEDMCPQYEQITRITEIDVHQPEKHPSTSFPMPSRMVKKLARSAAGQEAPLPMDVRSIPALKRTFDYLIDELLQDDSNLPSLHGFLWDRTRAIRRDFTFFSSLTPEELKIQVYVLENTARFHVTALHLLSQEGKAPEDFVEQQELEQLGKALLSLRDVYDDCNEQGIICENEPEFRAYYLIFHGRDSNIIETLQRQWRPTLWKDHDVIRTAASLVEAMQSTQDFHGPLKDGPSLAAASSFLTYFKIVEDPSVSYTMACFAECHFPHIRRSILSAVKRGLARPKDTAKDVTAAVLNRFLRFDTVQAAIAFAELHDLEWAQDPDHPYDISRQYLVLNNRRPLSHPRLSHHFSQTLVEKKRGSRSLPDIIHQSIFEDASAANNISRNPFQKGSSFVEDMPAKKSPFSSLSEPAATPFTQTSVSASPSTLGPTKASPFATTSNNGQLAMSQAAKPPAFTPQLPPPAANPFSSAITKQPQPSSELKSSTHASPLFSLEPKPKDLQPAQSQGSSLFMSSSGTEPKAEQKETRAVAAPASILAPSNSSTDALSSPFGSTKPPSPTQFPSISRNEPPKVKTEGPKIEFSAQSALHSGAAAMNNNLAPQRAPPSLGINKPLDAASNENGPTASIRQQPLSRGALSASASGFQSNQEASSKAQSMSGQGSVFSDGLLPAQPTTAVKAQTLEPSPLRDPMGDFTQWFLLGDQGLLDEFKAYIVEDMLSKLYDSFYLEQEEKRRQEAEAELLAEADAFRAYNLSMRYFYRWKDLAREKRLRTVRRQARDQARKFYEQQRAAEKEARRKAAQRSAKEKAHSASVNRPDELMHLLKNKKIQYRQQAEESLLASGVLSGTANEREAIAEIVRREISPSVDDSACGRQSMRSRSGSGTSSAVRGGSKTRALREELLGGSSASFRRSLPSMSASARSSAEPEGASRKSRVSERWRLKAMGITQMPDGTAMPDSLANEILYGGRRYREIGADASRSATRRASIGDSGVPDSFAMPPPRSTPAPRLSSEATSPTKRKRSEEDEENERRRSGIAAQRGNSHKRIMSGAEQVISELRALRMEMEEGSAWFREQNERLQSEAASRATTPWGGSIS